MSEHTKGPWYVYYTPSRGNVIHGADERPVARVATYAGLKEAEYNANATLIAAAPEMLELLEDMLDSYGTLGEGTRRARAAIGRRGDRGLVEPDGRPADRRFRR